MEDLKAQLNEKQYEAVTTTEGAVLVLAGAGTGKTRVITYRIAYIINTLGVDPSSILAVTFTNKAAGEMKQRLVSLVGSRAGGIWLGTFHSICLYILKRDGDKVGLSSNIGVIDQEDRLGIVRTVMHALDMDVKKYPPKQYLHMISAFKNTTEYVEDRMPVSDTLVRFGEVYRKYQEQLWAQKMIDFDDMLSLTVRLFLKEESTLNDYRSLFKYILVDEYQDTNAVQFKFLYMLAEKGGNICVVGDDDQSIYGWRGADIGNILNFDSFFDNVKEIKLVGNYRSGEGILNAANKLIEHNLHRRGKTLSACRNMQGKISSFSFGDERAEADFVASNIRGLQNDCEDLSSIAVLYRTNAQSRNFEVALNKARIPYKVIGGIGFYQRREIKDVLSYLRVFDNPYDVASFRRSLKNPPRGIGDTTLDKLSVYASDNNVDLLQALNDNSHNMARSRQSIERYLDIMSEMKSVQTIKEKIDYVVEKVAYKEYLKQFEEPDEASRRIDNLMELFAAAVTFEEQEPNGTLSDFLANTALVGSEEDEGQGVVKLMTMHAAKGLEFKTVFLTGLEEGLFPLSSADEEGNIEEERRLCYVGVTRAKDTLYISNVMNRFRYGKREMARASRFLSEISGLNAGKVSKQNLSALPQNHSQMQNNSQPSSNSSGLFQVSDKVVHQVFGDGVVLFSEGSGASEKVTVNFRKSGLKKILASFLNKR